MYSSLKTFTLTPNKLIVRTWRHRDKHLTGDIDIWEVSATYRFLLVEKCLWMLSINKLNDHLFVIPLTISWSREAMKTLNFIVINIHTRLQANLYNLAFQLNICYIIWNITKFQIVPSAICSELACFFYKSVTLFSSLLLTTLTIASLLLVGRFAVGNFVIVSDEFEIW